MRTNNTEQSTQPEPPKNDGPPAKWFAVLTDKPLPYRTARFPLLSSGSKEKFQVTTPLYVTTSRLAM